MKRFFKVAMAIVLCMGLTLTDCGFVDNTSVTISGTTTSGTTGQSDSSKAAIDDKETIYFISLKVGGAVWSQTQQGFKDVCKGLGWDGYYVAPTIANDFSQTANLCEATTMSDADAVLGPLLDRNIFIDITEYTHGQGMLVGTTNTYLDGIEDLNIGTDQENVDVIQAETLIDLAGDSPYKVVWMTVNAGNVSTMETYDALCQALEGHGNISIHGIKLDDNSPTTATDKMNNLWKADPAISAAVCNDSSDASLDIPDFTEGNDLQDEFYFIGVDASADILNYIITDGLDYTLDQNFYRMGHGSVYMLEDVWDSKEVEGRVDSGMSCVINANAVEYGASRGYEVTAIAR